MMNYKLIALDMDGTFLKDDNSVSEENKAAIKAATEAGVTVMFATGRGIMHVLPYMEDLGMASPIVTVNGSEVWEKPGILHNRTLLNGSLVSELYRIAEENDCWYWANAVDERYEKGSWPDQTHEKQWLKFGIYVEDKVKLRVVYDKLESFKDVLEMSNSHPLNIEFNAKGVNKVNGVRQVCHMLDIDMSQVIAVGDSLNDELLIREAGLGVAMGNAQEYIKQVADIIVGTNEEHGVAETIKKHIVSK